MRTAGWSASACAATPMLGNHSGGLVTATVKRVGLALVAHFDVEIVPARAAMYHVGGMVRGGFVIVNLYLVHSVGIDEQNWSIFAKVGARLKTAGLPFIIGGDWNFTVDELQKTSWVDAMDAVVIAPEHGTCRPALRCIDVFVVSRQIAGQARAEVLQNVPISPPPSCQACCPVGRAVMQGEVCAGS